MFPCVQEQNKGTLHFVLTFGEQNGRTALHAGKDLAVSPSSFNEILPKGSLGLSASASLLAPLRSLETGVTRYPLHIFICDMFGLSSLRLALRQNKSACPIQWHDYTTKYN